MRKCCWFLGLLLMLTFAGCGGNDNKQQTSSNNEDASTAVETSVTEVNSKDLLFNEPLVFYDNKELVIYHNNYIVSYDKQNKLPKWVAYAIDSEEVKGSIERAKRFEPDPTIKANEQSEYYDFSHSGYDRGHMAPAGDMRFSQEAMDECFYLTNICPQDPDLNAGVWNDVERMVRRWTKKSGKVYVVCGPIVGKAPKCIGKGQVAVPDQFFKVLLKNHNGKWSAIAYLFPNTALGNVKYNDYATSVDEVEQLTGLDFFYSLPDGVENEIESRCDTTLWCGKTPKHNNNATK